MKLRGLFSIIAALILTSCAPAVLEKGLGSALIATPTPTFTCSYYLGYDTLGDCQSETQARCTSEWQTFPTGGIALCYKPVAGYEACAVAVPTWDWVYTTYSAWCDTQVAPPLVFRKTRSLIGCSSAICNCSTTPDLSATCTNGVDCPASVLVAPTPGPCP